MRILIPLLLFFSFPTLALAFPEHRDFRRQFPSVAARGLSEPAGLESRFCGDGKETSGYSQGPDIKLVYTYPKGGRNRIGELGNSLQASAVAMSRFIATESGFKRTLALDWGSSCGISYLDLGVLELEKPARNYLHTYEGGSYYLTSDFKSELEQAYPHPQRNYLLFMDQMVEPGAPVLGQSNGLLGARPDQYLHLEKGGFVSVVWGSGKEPGLAEPLKPIVFLHELTHALGGVLTSAPNYLSGGHCHDGRDVMCYSDGKREVTAACEGSSGWVVTYDCGGDDYFNPSPAPGSYLDTHWNIYNSPFLRSCSVFPKACHPGERYKAYSLRVREYRDGWPRGPRLPLAQAYLSNYREKPQAFVRIKPWRLGKGSYEFRACYGQVADPSEFRYPKCSARAFKLRKPRTLKAFKLKSPRLADDSSRPYLAVRLQLRRLTRGRKYVLFSSNDFVKALLIDKGY